MVGRLKSRILGQQGASPTSSGRSVDDRLAGMGERGPPGLLRMMSSYGDPGGLLVTQKEWDERMTTQVDAQDGASRKPEPVPIQVPSFVTLCKRICMDAKNLIVPRGTFGTGPRARRTEWCALVVYLSVWIPVYIILVVLLVVIYRSGWIEGMSVQTSYVNRLAPPSLMFCPMEVKCGLLVMDERPTTAGERAGWSPPFRQYGVNPAEIFMQRDSAEEDAGDAGLKPPPAPAVLPERALTIVFASRGRIARIRQPLDQKVLFSCGCGECVCLRTALLSIPVVSGDGTGPSGSAARNVSDAAEVIQPVFESFQSETSRVRTLQQGTFYVEGFFFPALIADRPFQEAVSEASVLRVGWYGENVPMSVAGFPEQTSWVALPLNTSTRVYFRVNRVRLCEQDLRSIATVMTHLWAPFLIQFERFNPRRADIYAEHHEYRLSVAPNRATHVEEYRDFLRELFDEYFRYYWNSPDATLENLPPVIRVWKTSLSIGVLTFFQQEQSRVGPLLSVVATLGLAGVLLVLIHRTGAFFVCFRRYEARHPRLMVNSILKRLSGGQIAEDHISGSFEI